MSEHGEDSVTRHFEPGYCPDCEVYILGAEPHLCEHGVTPPFSISITMRFKVSPEEYERYKRLCRPEER